MMVLTGIGLLVGILLAQHFKVLALVPAAVLALTAGIGVGVFHADSAAWIAWTAASSVIALQLGYFIGLFIHHVLATGRTGRVSLSVFKLTTSRRLGVR